MPISLLLLFNSFIIIQMISNSLGGRYARLYVTNTQLTWYEGEQACLDTFGTHLGSIHSEEDNELFAAACSKNGTSTSNSCFFGLNAPDCDYPEGQGSKCNWQWSDGTPLDYTSWWTAQGNPLGMAGKPPCDDDGECASCPQFFVTDANWGIWNSFRANANAPCYQDRVCVCNAPTSSPTTDPTTTTQPTTDPTTGEPTTNQPTNDPTGKPTNDPTFDPTSDPTSDPTNDPTIYPTTYPTDEPTMEPTNNPTNEPTLPTPPTLQPSMSPTMKSNDTIPNNNGSDGIMYQHSLFVYGIILLICIYIF